MSDFIINTGLGCIDCTYSDKYGRDCKFGLMFPVALIMSGKEDCPNFKHKNTYQINEQLNHGK